MGTLLSDCIRACEEVYASPQIAAGPKNRDGASIMTLSEYRLLAFRGTLTSGLEGLRDWMNDLRVELVSDPRFAGQVHAGFLGSMRDLWPSLKALEYPPDNKPLVITGHSKGGALAFLAGWLLRAVHPLVLTFGSPRVGDSEFAAHYDVRAIRAENRHDVVPGLPQLFYHHAGCLLTPPPFSTARDGIVANHALDTGYRPWIMALDSFFGGPR